MLEKSGFNFMASLPQATKHLILINVLVWLVAVFMPNFDLNEFLGLHYFMSDSFNPIQLVTYMFLHGGFTHLFFNMFSLFMFGRFLESMWGTKRFLLFYFVSGLGAALVQEVVWYIMLEPDYVRLLAQQISESTGALTGNVQEQIWAEINARVPERMEDIVKYSGMLCTIGASGAVFGILLGFAFVFPNMPLYFMFVPIPIKAKYFVLFYAVVELLFGVSGKMDSVAHFAHLGGMLFALVLLLYWKKKGNLRRDYF